MKYTVTIEDERFEIEVGRNGRVWVNQRPYNVDLQDVDGMSQYSLLMDHRSYETHVEHVEDGECLMLMGGRPYRAFLNGDDRPEDGEEGARNSSEPQSASCAQVRAPLPGLLVEVPVSEGDVVGEQDVVAVLESMKMNLELRAPQSGTVQRLSAVAGREVTQGEVLTVIGPEA